MNDKVDEIMEDLEEHADMHDEDCSCMMEDPDACDCDTFAAIRLTLEKHLL